MEAFSANLEEVRRKFERVSDDEMGVLDREEQVRCNFGESECCLRDFACKTHGNYKHTLDKCLVRWLIRAEIRLDCNCRIVILISAIQNNVR